MAQAVRQLLAEVRTLLADQGGLGLHGLDLPAACLRPVQRHEPRPKAIVAAPRTPADAAFEAKFRVPHHARSDSSASASASGAAAPTRDAAPVRLRAVRDDLGPCTRCALAQARRNIVFGAGNAAAEVVFVGEGPGRDEDAQGLPFVGEAGRLLTRMLVAMKLSREEVYIANVVKCRPPGNRFPEPDEQASCSPFLWRQLAAIRPRVVVALGRLASQTLLAQKLPMGKMRGGWQQLRPPPHLPELRGLQQVPVMPTFHPAYLLRRPEDKILVWRDLQAVMARLAAPRGSAVPGAASHDAGAAFAGPQA